jgi:protein-disulfide isomerase
MNVESFASSHPLKELKLSNEVKAMAELQEKWIEEIGVSKTPTIFINDYELPSLYTIADLHRILPDLAEYYFLENQHSNLKS